MHIPVPEKQVALFLTSLVSTDLIGKSHLRFAVVFLVIRFTD
jgi:hypothetical protein